MQNKDDKNFEQSNTKDHDNDDGKDNTDDSDDSRSKEALEQLLQVFKDLNEQLKQQLDSLSVEYATLKKKHENLLKLQESVELENHNLKTRIDHTEKLHSSEVSSLDEKVSRKYANNAVELRDYTASALSKIPFGEAHNAELKKISPPLWSFYESLITVFNLIDSKLLYTLSLLNTKEIQVEKGDEFNSEIHNAVITAPAEEGDDNKVLEEIKKGYLIGNKVLRPAIVIVGKKTT